MGRVTDLLGIEHPIIQGPFGGFASQELTATVSNLGGLGSFGGLGLTPTQLHEVIAKLRSLTSKPFAINLWVSTEDEARSHRMTRASGEAWRRWLRTSNGLEGRFPLTRPTSPSGLRIRFES